MPRAARTLAAVLALLPLDGCMFGLGPETPRGVKDNYLNAALGGRRLSNGAWGPAASQYSVVMSHDSRIEGWPVSLDFAFGYAASGTRDYTFEGGDYSAASDSWEWDLGLLKRFQLGDSLVQPYVGLGASLLWVAGKLEVPGSARDRDWTVGAYGRLGLAFELDPGTFVGLDLRLLGLTDVTIDGADADVDGAALSVSFSYGF